MQSHPHRHRKWRRFARNNRNLFFVGFFLVIILSFVVAFFWLLTSSRFVKP